MYRQIREVHYTERLMSAAAIHDMSGFGRCSLAVILPVISAMGIQCVPVPTAVLSTHTGGFDGFVFEDMTDFLSGCIRHYKELGLEFDAVYSGFLASEAQVDRCLEFFEAFPSAKRIVDPVMGDNGERYKTYTDELTERMKELVSAADLITPNITEAAMLLGERQPDSLNDTSARDWLERLCRRSKAAVITGIPLGNGIYSNMSLDTVTGEFSRFDWNALPASYPGTGDIFASVMTGSILKGASVAQANEKATAFSRRCVEVTLGNGQPERNGVEFERVLPELYK